MKTLRTTLFALGGLGALASTASANAFNINEHDPRVTGRGGATAASNTEPSSIVFNPGGIAINEGTQVAISTSFYLAKGSYENADTPKTETDSPMSVVPSVYVTSRVHEMVAVGIGLHFPFGLAISWPEGHAQSDIMQDQSLRTTYISPVVGFNLHKQVPGLSIGGGVDIVPATIEIERTITFGDVQGNAHLGGDGVGFGGRVGVMYHPPAAKGLKLGVMYRSPVNIEFTGKGDFDIAPEFRAQLPPDGDIKAEITLPQSVWGGVAYEPIPELEFEVNAVWIDWSSTWDDEGDLTIELPGDTTSSAPQDYESTVSYRLGAEYRFPAQQATIRAGFIYDPTPIPDTTQTASLPDINRKNVSLGGSKLFGDYGVHLGLLWVTPGERDTSDVMYMPQFKGRYGVQAFVASLGVSGAFGK
jgi:long-chain fatty acid transport protein